ncbi:glycerophosphodiester phosphodiesterase [Streptomyces botrytidirepellens]|uniref:Glycerophosphodiester phosphodiesterase n=1 Tax=Streptomyces botrytidirepellens TaxID=2486417 RepID=A0A3M8WVZ2_9ACTN|nr:glycerophosphodiester phosphodiesterase family protein [Streptomyces botrytidirepellens]RNG34332.1 glycerophosphodiester phosphodiesterase [Streptomyces botrytidirepellens]
MTDSRTFVLCGHRGNVADTPENTLSSFASAERVGVDEIELDVRVTRDDVLVVIHDRTAARTAATSTPHLHTPVEELTFSELRSVDLGSGERIPTFDEVLDATTVLLQVEIKAPAAARGLAKLLRDRPERDQARCLVTSFEPLSLSDYTDEWPDTPRGTALHVPDMDSNWRDDMRRLDVSTILLPLATLKRSLVDELHDAGYVVGGSLIEGPGDVRRLLELDVDMSASNAPEYARQLLLASDEFTSRFPSFARNDAALTPEAS